MKTLRRFTSTATFLWLVLGSLSCVHHGPDKDLAVQMDDSSVGHQVAIQGNHQQLDFNEAQQFSFVLPTPPADNVHPITHENIYCNAPGYGFDLNTSNNNGNPFYFSVRVPQGNYRVSIEFGHPHLASSNTVKAESRRLYVHNLATAPGEFVRREFIVNMRDNSLRSPEKNAPGGTQVLLKSREQHQLHWDDKLTLEFNGAAPQVRSVTLQKVDVPTIYLVGDSTVTDQPYEPAASWGQMLPIFFDPHIAIANHAESGETLKSFISELRFAKVLESMKPGDYMFIQFGHNDQKKQWPQTYAEAETTYQDYLNVFIAEARLRGATPVLITSMQRRTFDANGKIINTHGHYPQAVRQAAKARDVALIDLDAMSIELYEALGIQNAPLAFNDDGRDATHHNNYGALQLAKCVVQGTRQAQLPLTSHLLKLLPVYDPRVPDPVDDFFLSPSPQVSAERPPGN